MASPAHEAVMGPRLDALKNVFGAGSRIPLPREAHDDVLVTVPPPSIRTNDIFMKDQRVRAHYKGGAF